MHLVSRKARKEAEDISRIIFDSKLDAEKPRWHVKGVADCKRQLKNSRDETLAAEDSTK